MITSKDSQGQRTILCSVCRAPIQGDTNIHQSSFSLSVVCDDCYGEFAKDDVEMMLNMFLAYGGYFGKFKESDITVQSLLSRLLGEIKAEKGRVEIKELNIRLMHKALLYGISPSDFVGQLSRFVDEL